jgi:restriction system protein
VQILLAKVQSVGAHKGILFSVAGFQEGAVAYASTHGIALVQLCKGETTWFARTSGPAPPPPSEANIPKYVGWWYHGEYISVLSETNSEFTR